MHLMVDLETLATSPDAVVLSIGLVFFTKEDGIVHTAYSPLDVRDQITNNRKVDFDTLLWWLGQSDEAKKVFEECRPAKLPYLSEFLTKSIVEAQAIKAFNLKHLKIWGNGAIFDVGILEYALRKEGEETPWKFWNVMCFKTLNKLTNIKKKVERKGTYHNALDDSLYQTECVLKVMRGNDE